MDRFDWFSLVMALVLVIVLAFMPLRAGAAGMTDAEQVTVRCRWPMQPQFKIVAGQRVGRCVYIWYPG